MPKVTYLLAIYLIVINLISFAFFGADKRRARQHRWRIPEATLLTYSFIGGGTGSLMGMLIFHHKTRKMKFRILVPISTFLWIGIIVWVVH